MIDIDQNTSNKCACKGIRKCALCSPCATKYLDDIVSNSKTFIYCPKCQKSSFLTDKNLPSIKIFLENSCQTENIECFCSNDDKERESIRINGIFSKINFINNEEEDYLINEINNSYWNESQSGRFKQDFGPKANFNKKKLKYNTFSGLPYYSKFLVDRINQTVDKIFNPVELCNLKYDRLRAACIDPHYDDKWLWGDRLITVNLLENTYLTLNPGLEVDEKLKDIEILLPMPRRSLLILSDDARNKWMHSIKNSHINSLRIAMTFRELSDYFIDGEIYEILGKKIEKLAVTYKGCAVGQIEKILANDRKTNSNNELNGLIELDEQLTVTLFERLNLDNKQTKIDIIKNNRHILTILAHDSKSSKLIINIKKSNQVLNLIFENIKNIKEVYDTDSLLNIFNLNVEDQNYLVCCQKYINSKENMTINQDNLLKIGKLIGKWRKIMNQIIQKQEKPESLFEDEIYLENIICINCRFEKYMDIYFETINSLKIDLSIKTMAIAILYNLKRLMNQLENEKIGIHKGIIIGGFEYHNIISHNGDIRILFSLEKIQYSYLINDLAMSICDFMLNSVESNLSYKDTAHSLLQGYEFELEKFDDLHKELLHNLILFNLILFFIKHEIKTDYLSIFENIYLDPNFLK